MAVRKSAPTSGTSWANNKQQKKRLTHQGITKTKKQSKYTGVLTTVSTSVFFICYSSRSKSSAFPRSFKIFWFLFPFSHLDVRQYANENPNPTKERVEDPLNGTRTKISAPNLPSLCVRGYSLRIQKTEFCIKFRFLSFILFVLLEIAGFLMSQPLYLFLVGSNPA